MVLPLSLLAACASHVRDDDSGLVPSENERAAIAFGEDGDDGNDAGPVIATMVTRDHRLAVRSAADKQVFTVMRPDGGVLAENIDLWQLARDYPELHRQFETAFAGEGIQLDARADRFGRECEGCSQVDARRSP